MSPAAQLESSRYDAGALDKSQSNRRQGLQSSLVFFSVGMP